MKKIFFLLFTVIAAFETNTEEKNCDIVEEDIMMKVAYCDGTGTSNIKFEERSKPKPSGREILIDVKASGLNRIDTYMSKGAFGKVDVLGMEVSGVVSECGDQVTMYKPGDKVMALLKDGGHAQFVSVDERHVIPIPWGPLIRRSRCDSGAVAYCISVIISGG